MSVSNGDFSFINPENNLVGTMNPLKMFFGPMGIDKTNSNNAFWHFKDAINKLQSQTGFGTDVVDNKMINTTIFNLLLEPGGSFDPNPVHNILQLDGTTDILMILAGNPKADANQTCSFNVRDFNLGGFMGARARVGAAAQGARFQDDNAVNIQVTSTNTTDVDQIVVSAFDRSVNANGHRNFGTGASIEDSFISMATANGPVSFSSQPEISINSDAYAAGLYYFPNGLPLDWKEVSNWLGWNWANQNYIVGPSHWEEL